MILRHQVSILSYHGLQRNECIRQTTQTYVDQAVWVSAYSQRDELCTYTLCQLHHQTHYQPSGVNVIEEHVMTHQELARH
jgi:hypothetical protein